jgi:hypothetical protein
MLWQGESLDGKILYIQCEQDAADIIRFLRFVPLVAASARQVILEVPRALVRIAAALSINNLTIVSNERPPPHDLRCPLSSLARRFAVGPARIQGTVPYLTPRRAIVERWAQTLGADAGIKVGLVWAGSAAAGAIALHRLSPLMTIAGVSWNSLQAGPPAAEIETAGLTGLIADLSARLPDFAELAGAILNLDLLIAVDSPAAHLAGALGRPAWILLPSAPDSRWLLERENTPWYPSLRLYRQQEPGDWDAVMARVAASLSRLAARHAERGG